MATSFEVRQVKVQKQAGKIDIYFEGAEQAGSKPTVAATGISRIDRDRFFGPDTGDSVRRMVQESLSLAISNYPSSGCLKPVKWYDENHKVIAVGQRTLTEGADILYKHVGSSGERSCDKIEINQIPTGETFTLRLNSKGNVDGFAQALKMLVDPATPTPQPKQLPVPPVVALAPIGVDTQKRNWIPDLLEKTKLTNSQLVAILQSISDYSSIHKTLAEVKRSARDKSLSFYNVKADRNDPKNKTYLRFYYEDSSPNCLAVRTYIDYGSAKALMIDFNGDITVNEIKKAIASLTAKNVGTQVAIVK